MIYVFSTLLGLVFGSFANVCISRLPQGRSVFSPGSHCPYCKTPLRWIDNIPLFSFLLLKGHCSFCKRSISWQYPLVEASMAMLFFISAWKFDGALNKTIAADLLSFYLLTIATVDYTHKIIPDELSLSMLALGLILSAKNPFLPNGSIHPFLQSLFFALMGAGGMLFLAWAGEKIFKREALGGGDIKFVGAVGSTTGGGGLIGSLFLGSLLGGGAGLLLLALKLKKKGETIPFGPFLSAGAYFTLLFPRWWQPFLFP